MAGESACATSTDDGLWALVGQALSPVGLLPQASSRLDKPRDTFKLQSPSNLCMVRARSKVIRFPTDPQKSAEAAGLRYVRDDQPGITRVKAGKGFRYVSADGATVTDKSTLKRIRALVIPPA